MHTSALTTTLTLTPYLSPLHAIWHNLLWLAPLLALVLLAVVAFGWLVGAASGATKPRR